MHPTHLLPVRGRRAPSRRQGTREGIHYEARWRAFYAERKCEFRALFSARAAQNEFFYSTLFWTPFSGERPPYLSPRGRPWLPEGEAAPRAPSSTEDTPYPPPPDLSPPAAARTTHTSHDSPVTNDTRGPPVPTPASANEVHYTLYDNTWLASAFAERSVVQGRIDHLRHLLDTEELRQDVLNDAIGKHHLMVRSRHHRDGLLHHLSGYPARPDRTAQSARPDIPDVD